MPGDARNDFLVAAEFALALRHDLDLPALALGITRVHAEEIGSEQRRLITAGTGADFEKDVALVVGIFRQQLGLQLLFEIDEALARFLDLGFGEFAHRRVARHFLGGRNVFLALAIRLVELDYRADLGMFARELAIAVEIGRGVFGTEQLVEFFEADGQLRKLGGDAGFHSECFN